MKIKNNKKEVKMEMVIGLTGQRVDLDAIAYGPKSNCRKLVIEGRECLEVSRPFEVDIPDCKAVDKLKKSFIVDIKRNAMVGDLHVCYEALYDENDKPNSICDNGFTMEGDKEEFGHYMLWNEVTGEFSFSDFLGWEKVGIPLDEHLADAKKSV